MSIFRRNRLSDEQLRELLQSLPQMKAPDDFDAQLDRMVSLHSEHVPHMLGSMPMVPAPDDFDARLMEAIRDNRRRVAPLPAPIAAGGVSINWLNHIMGWLGGSLAVVALAFFIHQPSSDAPAADTPASSSPIAAVAPASGTPTAVAQVEASHGASSGSVGAPYGVTILQTTSLASAVRAVGRAPLQSDVIALEQQAPQSRPDAIASPAVITRTNEPATMPARPHSAGTPAAAGTESGTATSTGTPANVNTANSAPHTDTGAPVSTTTLDTHDQHGSAANSVENDTSTGASDQQIVNTGGDRPSDKDGFKTKTNP